MQEESGPLYDQQGAAEMRGSLLEQGFDVPSDPVDSQPAGLGDFDPEGWRSLLDLIVGYNDQGDPSMRGYEDWVNSQLRHGMDRDQARREYDDIVRRLNPDQGEGGWNYPENSKAQGDWVDLPGRETSPWGWSPADWPTGYDEHGGRDALPVLPRGLRDLLQQPEYQPGPWDYNENASSREWNWTDQPHGPGELGLVDSGQSGGYDRTPGGLEDLIRARMGQGPSWDSDPYPPVERPVGPQLNYEGGNWLYGNDQSLLSYHPMLNPFSPEFAQALGGGPEPGAVAGGAAAGSAAGFGSLLELLPFLLGA
jgi:hypothetical protein